jgi:hypothetical protein
LKTRRGDKAANKMVNPIWDIVTSLVKPLTDLISKAVPDADKKIELQGKIVELQFNLLQNTQAYEQQLLDAQKSVITAEANSSSWLAKSWRPVTMLTFLVLVVCDSFGWLPNRLAPEAWSLLQIGIGGYVVGRSVEKVAPSVAAAIGNAIKVSKTDGN